MKNIFYLILLITIGVNAQTYAPSTPILNGNVRITTPPTAQPANQPYIMLWGQNAPYNVLGKYLVSDLFTQFGTIPTFQQVLNAGSTANINTPFIVNYKLGTPQAVEFSINDANFQVGVPGANNLLTFDDGFVGFSRPVNGIDATASNQFTTLGQLNNALQSYNLQQVTDNGNITTNDIILDALNTGSINIKGAYDGVPDGSVITFQGDGSVKINTDENGQDLGSAVGIAGIRVSGKKISSSDAIYDAPINDYDFAQKKYVDDAIQGVSNVTLQEAYNNGQDIDMNGGDFNVVNGMLIGFDADNIQIGSGTGTTNLGQQTITMPALPVNNTPPFYVGLSNTGQLFKSNAPTSTPANLSYTASGTNGVVNNSNGTGFTIPAVTGSLAGLFLPGDYNRLLNTSGTNTGNEVQATEAVAGKAAIASATETTTGTDNTKIITPAKLKQIADTKITAPATSGALFYNQTNNTTTAVTGNGGQVLRPNATTVNQNNLVFDIATLTTHNPAAGVVAAGDMLVTVINKIVGNMASNKYISGFTTITANYTVTMANFGQNGQFDIYANATNGNITITLPGATNMAGYQVNVIKTDNTANSVTISGGTTNINQSTTYPLTTINQNVTVKSDNTQYRLFN